MRIYSGQIYLPRADEFFHASGQRVNEDLAAGRFRLGRVKVNRLIPTQRTVSQAQVVATTSKEPIDVVSAPGGWFFIWDGHHRFASALFEGLEELPARIVGESHHGRYR